MQIFFFPRYYRATYQLPLLRCCSKCGGEFPHALEYFSRHGPRLRSVCRSCRNKENAARGHRDYTREQIRRKGQQKLAREWRARTEAGFPPAPRRYWTTRRAAVELGIGERTLQKWAQDGRIAAVRHGKAAWRFEPDVVRAKAREMGINDEYAVQAAD